MKTKMTWRRMWLPLAVMSVLVPSTMAGCGADSLSDATSGVCCTDFKVGADLSGADFGVDASLKGQFNVFAQATSDLAATATASLADIEIACRNIAMDLGAAQADQDAAQALTGTTRVDKWCTLAAAQIKADFGASGQLAAGIKVDFAPPVCEASVSAKADCQGKCSGSAKCDVKANPPKCEGGKLEVECKGECTAEGSASLSCEGSCSGTCEGSCSASGGVAVDCDGKCDGSCTVNGAAGTNATQADGMCKGKCSGTCTARVDAPKVACQGTCNGQCTGSCKGSATASVKCDGKCNAEYQPLKCKGGELKGGCNVEASCDANCNASVKAKAECRPPSLKVTADIKAGATADIQTRYNVAIESLEANLPTIVVAFKARGQAFVNGFKGSVEGGAKIVANPGSLGAKGAICFGSIVAAGATGIDNFTASFQAAGKVAGSAGIL